MDPRTKHDLAVLAKEVADRVTKIVGLLPEITGRDLEHVLRYLDASQALLIHLKQD